MYNKNLMVSVLEALGFQYSGYELRGDKYILADHVVVLHSDSCVHFKPNGTRKWYYSDASTARIRSALVKSIEFYK